MTGRVLLSVCLQRLSIVKAAQSSGTNQRSMNNCLCGGCRQNLQLRLLKVLDASQALDSKGDSLSLNHGTIFALLWFCRHPFMTHRLVYLILTHTILALSACGGGGQPTTATPPVATPARVVAAADVPALSNCLGHIGAALRKDPLQRDVGLDCASGVYRGLTATGRACSLEIDGASGAFEFRAEDEVVQIRWENVAYTAEGKAVHNLEDTSAPQQPGIQLTRFEGAPTPVTQSLALRMGRGSPVLPTMVYQRSEAGAGKSVLCNFGK